MSELQLRKQALLLESDLNRIVLHAECERLRETACLVKRVVGLRDSAGAWAALLVPVAGAALALAVRRSSRSNATWLARALDLLPVAAEIAQSFSASKGNAK